ncbi:histidine kinase [Pontibacter kalidii]|uniref:histidine kinase n=1 Tax=Pontibacter kalidii TaxID=2592049 RepID=UPI002259E574|nr:histidine kinase [Pontibacter kalidii]
MDIVQIDLQQLRIKHIFFKTRVRAILYGGTYDASLFSPQSPVDIWFSTTGSQRYAGSAEVMKLSRLHQSLVFSGRTLYRQYIAGNIEQAHDEMKNIDSLSEQFLALLSQMEQGTKA